jgi:hypothetical protein
MHPIMIDSLKKVTNYRDARQNVKGWHSIVPAEVGAVVWKQKTCSIVASGNKRNHGPQRVGHGLSGYVNKNGFHQHT